MKYTFKRAPSFRKAFDKLPLHKQREATKIFRDVFRRNPFHAKLNVHRINRLKERYKSTVYGAYLGENFRVIFILNSNEVIGIDIGTHDIYK